MLKADDTENIPPTLPPGYFYLPPAISAPRSFIVEDSDAFDAYHYRISTVVSSEVTPFQHIVIADTCNYGRALFIDGSIQSALDDEALYHEALIQPAMLFHEAPRDVLVIGGGEGASLREVLKHRSVRRVTMVDLDPTVIELSRTFLAQWHRGSFNDPRVDIRFEDGRKYIEVTEDRFDVIIIDVVDMLDNGPAQGLYTRQFYEMARSRLRRGGIIAVQALEFSHLDYKAHAAMARTLRTVFPEVHSYRVAIPSFLGTWGFLLASNDIDPANIRQNQIDQLIANRLVDHRLEHLDGEFLKSAFVLCRSTRLMLSLPGPRLEDDLLFKPPPDVEFDEAAARDQPETAR